VLRKRDFENLLKELPTLIQAVRNFFQQGEIASYLQQRQGFDPTKAAHWVRTAVHSMDLDRFIPSAAAMTETIKAHQGAPFAILLGNVLDGIPGVLVVDTSMYHTHVSISLIAGLFLSNYPAALSSSIGMQQQGLTFTRALWMWTAVTLLTGIGAAAGYVFFAGASPSLCALVEGIAVGASLTMLAETMLPEAYFRTVRSSGSPHF
jgi:zinc transporter ZupT